MLSHIQLTAPDIPLGRGINPYAAGGKFGQYKMMQKAFRNTETLAHVYSVRAIQ